MAKKPRKWSTLKDDFPPPAPELSAREQRIREEVDARRTRYRIVCSDCDYKNLSTTSHTTCVNCGSLAIIVTPEAVTMKDLAEEYRALDEEAAFEEAMAKERSVKFEALERRILEELRNVEEVSGSDLWRGDGQTFSPQNRLIPIVKDKAALRRWIDDNGLTNLLELPHGRLAALVSEALDPEVAATLTPAEREAAAKTPGLPASGAPPPGVEIYIKPGVHRTSR